MNDRVFELSFEPSKTPDGDLKGITVRIELQDGNKLLITGTSGRDEYIGSLVLRKIEGGDQCWVCSPAKECEWTVPCPS